MGYQWLYTTYNGGGGLRKTKIVCTLGPASDDLVTVKALIERGMNVARLNFSHGSHEEHRRRIELVRAASAELGCEVGVMLDTRGPEIRTGSLKNGAVELRAGDAFTLTSRSVEGNEQEVQVSYAELPHYVEPGERIMIADGLLSLLVTRTTDTDIICEVVTGGMLGERKGINVPGVKTNLPFLNSKDVDDISFGIHNGIDFVAASFVRTAEDVLEIRKIIEEKGASVDIIAKIESQEAVNNLDEIIRAADGVMVARGDLGVEIPTEEVPLVQKSIIQKCRLRGKPVIIATQMLESMVSNSRPTRAEASDIANAIFDGTDAVMLSGETAAGTYPLEAVETMGRIAQRAEEALPYEKVLSDKVHVGNLTVTDAISHATCSAALDLGASALITATKSGHTARMVAKYRPRAPIIAATPLLEVVRKLTLVWGVQAIMVNETSSLDEMLEEAVKGALARQAIVSGDLVVVTAGTPGVPGTTNLLRVLVVGDVVARGTGIGHRPVTGRARIVLRPEQVQDFSPGDILITIQTDRDFVGLFKQAGAVVTEQGGLTSNAAIVGISLNIPVVVGVPDATRVIREGELITVDTARGQIYRGEIKVL